MTRNEARENMMQIMYEMDTGKSMDRENAERLAEERLSGNHIERGKQLLVEIIDNLSLIDKAINDSSKSWKIGRMPKVDLAIMRLSLGEIKYCDDIPDAVAINEAINLAKKYSTNQSPRFVHGVLGAILNKDSVSKQSIDKGQNVDNNDTTNCDNGQAIDNVDTQDSENRKKSDNE